MNKTKKTKKKAKARQAKSGVPSLRGGLTPQNDKLMYQPAAFSRPTSFPMKGRKQSYRLTNSELVGTVSGTNVAFELQTYTVNPGLARTFPWLSREAVNWQQYRFLKLRFRYVTRLGTGSAGSIILSPEYNVRDPPPTTEIQATDTYGSIEDAVWKEIMCPLDLGAMFPAGGRKLIRSFTVAGDTNLYDSANVSVCVINGGPGDMGKLWVDYDVELSVPQNSPPTYSVPSTTSFYQLANTPCVSNVATPIDFDVVNDPLGFGTTALGVFQPGAGCYWVSIILNVSDDAAEDLQATLNFNKNLAVYAPGGCPVQSTVFNGGLFPTLANMAIHTLVSFNGTDTCSLEATLIGVAGNLDVNNALMIVRPA